MNPIEIARRLVALGETEQALRAYALVLNADSAPEELLEAAVYTLQNGGSYQVAYTTFIQLYDAGYFREDILPILLSAFYEPNLRILKNRYVRNVKLLKKYPYLFRRDFPQFDGLPILMFPFDDHGGYIPFDTRAGEFLGYKVTGQFHHVLCLEI